MVLQRLLIASACVVAAAQAQTPAAFWTAVGPDLQAVHDLRHEQDSLLGRITTHLHRLDPDLTCELGTAGDGVFELIVSADGLSRLIPTVRAVVGSAPAIKNWRFIAFRPRVGTSFSVKYEGYNLDPKALWFRPERDGKKVGLWLYLPGAEDEGHRQRAIGAAFIMLDMVIGELDAMTKIGFMEFRKLPQNPRGQKLRPIGELPAIVDSLP